MQRFRNIFLLIILITLAGGSYYWRTTEELSLPEGFAAGNSRIEATEVDIATKTAGKVEQIFVNEGDWVTANQLLAVMDTEQAKASLAVAEAMLVKAKESKKYAQAILSQRRSEVTLAAKEFDRTQVLVKKGHLSQEVMDQKRSQKLTAQASMQGASVQVAEADAQIAAAVAEVHKAQVVIDDSQLKTPRNGRVLYRLSEPGEVLAAGGKVITLIDVSDVYMVVFLPTDLAGKTRVGAEARIVVDAYPEFSIPATVSFVAPQAQFTPKAVETEEERQKLMFRVKVKIDPTVLAQFADRVKTGVPGLAFITLDDNAEWPEQVPPLIQY
ncbi:MAG TPA: HlyD family efflux transporter periplasmic adaptor subunit [Methylophaga aminisulfidivorans]|uniref:HlyD family efflux transporter periplasmic adaptor subunit n=1 Tax=Methylophaga aminisulfidivorans TaxID=230105 RepID=A0A7C1W307_9GAMM|nr:HlyD family efflux transporter periplasmic adaptor subunit [Methylophaga aminisulfidivorans]